MNIFSFKQRHRCGVTFLHSRFETRVKGWQVFAVDACRTWNVEIWKESVDMTGDAILVRCHTIKTENWNCRISDIKSHAFMRLILDMIDFNLL